MLLKPSDIMGGIGDPVIHGILTAPNQSMALNARVKIEPVKPGPRVNIMGAKREDPEGCGVEVTIRFRTKTAQLIHESGGDNLLLIDWAHTTAFGGMDE